MAARAPDPDLPAGTVAAMRAAREAWPDVEVSDAAFATYLASRGRGELAEGDARHMPDLYLACACAEGNERAVMALDRHFIAPLADIVARAGYPAHVGAEVTQALRERLLVGTADRPPRIMEYGGRAALASWLRVAAMREAGKVRRHERFHEGLRPDTGPPPATPEEAAMRARYGKAFEEAFADAFRALPAEDRLTLRLHFTQGLNLDGLAATFGFSRATAGRRLLLARARLRDATMRLFGERLDASGTEVESVLRVIGSALEVSLDALVTSA